MRVAFLDRDGTINVPAPPHEYVRTLDEFEYLPGAAEAVCALKAAGWRVFVVTNQRGVARGIVRQRDLDAIHWKLEEDLGVDGVYACVHGTEAACGCRKPAPGLLLQAAHDHGFSIGDAVLVGDADSDVEAGRRAGCGAVFRVGKPPYASLADVVRDLLPREEASRAALTT